MDEDILELANTLSQMYDDAPDGEKTTMIHLFGIRYARRIQENGISPNDIIAHTRLRNGEPLPDSYYAEINKCIKLSRYVIEKNKIREILREIME